MSKNHNLWIDRPTSNFDHRFGPHVRFLGNACSESSSWDDGFYGGDAGFKL